MIPGLGKVALRDTSLFLGKHCARLFLIHFVLAVICTPFNVIAQTAGAGVERDIDGKTRAYVVEEIVAQLRRRYVLPDAVDKIEAFLIKKLRDGGYDKATSAVTLSEALTEDLRTVADDLHFDVRYDPKRAQSLAAAGTGTRARLPDITLNARERESLRVANNGFGEVKVMLGNVGYLELNSFVDLKYSKNTAAAAMEFLGNTDAVLVDLRRNSGGSGNLVNFLISYFFGPEPVELMSSYDRETNTTRKGKTLAGIPGKRLPNVDVYVLTGPNTGSAAEAFAFTLQQVGRGKTIGERTVGAAHGGGWVPIGHGFVVFIPTFRGFNPRTGKSWNTVGVQPDIPATADRLIEAAHFVAVKGLLAKATSDWQKQQLSWIMPVLELRAYGQRPFPPAALSDLAGSYEGATITQMEGRLYFLGASGIRRNLLAIGGDSFVIEDDTVPPENQAQLRFVRSAEGKVTELQLMVRDGRAFRRAKQ
jgi:hypothetical protein